MEIELLFISFHRFVNKFSWIIYLLSLYPSIKLQRKYAIYVTMIKYLVAKLIILQHKTDPPSVNKLQGQASNLISETVSIEILLMKIFRIKLLQGQSIRCEFTDNSATYRNYREQNCSNIFSDKKAFRGTYLLMVDFLVQNWFYWLRAIYSNFRAICPISEPVFSCSAPVFFFRTGFIF